MNNQPMNMRKIVALAAAAGIMISAFVIYKVTIDSRFRITSSTPDRNGVVTTGTNGFKVVFNRKLNPTNDYKKSLEDSKGQVVSIKNEGDTLIIITKPHAENITYRFALNDIKSEDGSIIRKIDFNYTAHFKPFSKLSKDQKSLIESIARQPTANFPLLKHLPYSTLNFKLYVARDEADESGQIGTPGLVAELYLSNADIKSGRDSAIEIYKKEVQDYIKSLGYNPSDYSITYEAVEYSSL